MSNHFSADNLKFPGDDRRLDLTDVFVFKASDNPEHHHALFHRHPPAMTVLIIGPARPARSGCPPRCAATRSSPTSKAPCTDLSGPGTTTSPATTSTPSRWRYPATYSATARRSASGPRSARAVTAPWCRWTAAVTPPSTRSSTPDGEKSPYNSRHPADDVANYLGPWSKILENGGYTPEAAKAAALQALPDILPYDRTKPATYPNGRILTDDVYSARFAWLSNGKIPSAGLQPHGDLLAQFPYLGPPNP